MGAGSNSRWSARFFSTMVYGGADKKGAANFSVVPDQLHCTRRDDELHARTLAPMSVMNCTRMSHEHSGTDPWRLTSRATRDKVSLADTAILREVGEGGLPATLHLQQALTAMAPRGGFAGLLVAAPPPAMSSGRVGVVLRGSCGEAAHPARERGIRRFSSARVGSDGGGAAVGQSGEE